MIDRKTIDEINEKTDIVALVSNYVPLQKKGKNYVGLCPFHNDSNPSFSVSPERKIAKCFSCGEGGGPISFYQKINSVSFLEAITALAEPLGIKLNLKATSKPKLIEHEILNEAKTFFTFYLNNSEAGRVALAYLKKRKLTSEDIKHFNIGYAPKENDALYKLLINKGYNDDEILSSGLIGSKRSLKDTFRNRIMFPIHDTSGEVVGFSGRLLDGDGAKYYNSQDSYVFNKSEVLYHLYESVGEIRKHKKVILHEGFFDVIASYKAGMGYAVATMGTSLTNAHARALARITDHIIIAYDGDKAGIEAAYKAIQILKNTKMRVDVVKIPSKLDPDDYFNTYGKEKYLELFSKNLKSPQEFIYETTKENLNLSNVNDVEILKQTVHRLLESENKAVREIFIKRLSKDINVSVSSLSSMLGAPTVKPQPPYIVQPKIDVKKETQIPRKYKKAEEDLFSVMIKSKEKALQIDSELGIIYVYDMDVMMLRNILMEYYKYYDTFDEVKYLEMLEDTVRKDELILKYTNIISNASFILDKQVSEEQLRIMIKSFQLINLRKEYIEIVKEIEITKDQFEKNQLIYKQAAMKLELLKAEEQLKKMNY